MWKWPFARAVSSLQSYKKNFYLLISEVNYSADANYKTATNMTVLIKLGMIYA